MMVGKEREAGEEDAEEYLARFLTTVSRSTYYLESMSRIRLYSLKSPNSQTNPQNVTSLGNRVLTHQTLSY